ncbi:MAG: hypothetical protein P1U89_23760 [Verrucomicrobiales bacterium]|nr:hypothetical protein [Verrucomicrobiales bacterium]
MEFKDIKDVLTFAAFRPEADNPKYNWAQRFPKRKSVIVNISRGQCSWAYLDKRNQVVDVGEAAGEFAEVAGDMGSSWHANTEDGWIGISLNNRFIFTLEHNLSRKKGWEDEILTNPKSILGSKYDRTKRYALQHNPESSASLLLAADESMIKSTEETLRASNLRAARVCSGLFAMTGNLLARLASDPNFKQQDLLVITWNDGALSVLRQKAGQWQDLRCRSGISVSDENAIATVLKPFVEKADPNTRVIFMGEKQDSDFATQYLPKLGTLNVTDVTEENQIWNILANG